MITKHDEPAAPVADEPVADAPAAPEAAPAPQPRDAAATVEAWWDEFFPESDGAIPAIPYLSGGWHHCRAAKDELIRRLAGPPAPVVPPEGE